SGIGDINNDGIEDFAIGASDANAPNTHSGKVYVLFGKLGGIGVPNLADLSPSEGFVISGAPAKTFMGMGVSGVGDINADGIADFALGGYTSYVIYGSAAAGLADIDVAMLAPGLGFAITGTGYSDNGDTISGAGDVNGDGIGDLIFNEWNKSDVHVLFGRAGGYSNMNAGAPPLGSGFTILGPSPNAGSSNVSGGRDYNGDGYDDVIVGHGDNASVSVIFGKTGTDTVSTLALPDSAGVRFTGSYEEDVGRSVALADVNGDGFAEAIVGARFSHINGYVSGSLFVAYGTAPTGPVVRTGGAADQRIFGGSGADVLDGAGGDDQLTGSGGDDQLIGGDGNDTLFGGAGNDLLNGGEGNDLLDGGEGADRMIGGAGDDIYVVDNAGDLAVEEEGGGTDLVRTSRSVYTLEADIENLEGTGAAQTLKGNALGNTITGTGTNDKLSGLGGNDVLRAGSGNDLLNGGEGDDRMEGGAGDDWFVAGLGVDTADGGAGVDVLQGNFSGSTAGVKIDLRQATSSGAFGSYSNFEFFDSIVGSSFDDLFAGRSTGIEPMELGAGDDTAIVWGISVVHGGTGNDTLVVQWSEGYSTIFTTGEPVANAAGGFNGAYNDQFNNSVGYTSIETFEIHTGTSGSYIHTASGNDRLYGGSSGDSFFAGAGADILDGGGGNDRLDGQAGADSMSGGDGDDIYIVDDQGDEVLEAASAGTDEVRTSLANYYLRANFENLTGTAATGQSLVGNSLDNIVTGGSGNDSLIGSDAADFGSGNRGGTDTLAGGLGNDLYWVDDVDQVVEAADQGADEVRTRGNYTLTANVETLRGLSDSGQILQGNELGNAIFGKDGADTLRGLAGNDTLTGGAGNDVLEGGTGDDIYVVEGADTVTELAGEGTDEVRTALGSRSDVAQMYILTANVENFTGTSATGQGMYGNALNNVVAMGAGGDLVVLDGGGNDLVSGGGGDDFLYWGAAFTSADKADGGAGFDTVGLLGNYALTFDADDFVSIEKLAVYSSGNAAAPNGYSLTMHDGNVAAGQKMMVVAQSLAAGEAFTFNGAAEADGSFNVRGGRGGDTITGGAKADTIWGGLGADTLRGGAGADVFEYGSTAESKGAGADVIMDFAKGDKINLTPIDADGNGANGDTKFTWLGAGAFTGHAGELRVSQHPQYGTAWVVEADTNGDSVADFTLYLVAPAGFLPEKSDFYV
ncbi:MAG TPA: hypothetical protein VGB65_08785, partial [Allosphingosinicella sp.]